MKTVYKWFIWIGCILFVVSIVFNIVLLRLNSEHKHNARLALGLGIGQYRIANDDLRSGDINKAFWDDGMGYGEMNAASNNLPKQYNNIMKLSSFLQLSIYNRAHKKYSSQRIAQDKHIFDVMLKTFEPVMSHPDSVSNNELEKYFKKVFNAMTPEQKQTMGG